jgi:hypothetical protein
VLQLLHDIPSPYRSREARSDGKTIPTDGHPKETCAGDVLDDYIDV